MSTENNCDIPFTLLNDGKRLLYSGTQEPRLLDLFPVSAEEHKLLELFPAGAQEHRLLELFPAGAQEPRLLQLFPVGGESEDNDGTPGSDPLAGASEPELPNLPANHYSQPPTSLVLAQRSGNSLALDRNVQVMLNSLIREWGSLSLDNALNETEGFPSRIHNSLSKLAEHTIRPAAENVTTLAAAISICRPHNTREVTISPVTADQSGSSPAGRGLAKTRPVPIQELLPTSAKHLSRRQPEREDSANRSLPASIEHINKGQLAVQEPLTPGSVNTRSAVGGQLVTWPPTRVEPVLENAKNLTMLATTALPPPTRWVNINPVAADQSRSSHTGWGLTKKRSLAVQEPLSTRSENVGRRQPERDELVSGSLPASREHVMQRLPSHIGPVKKRRLAAVQEPLPSRQDSMRGQLGNITPPARGEPMLEHGNQRPPIGGELVLGHVNVRPAPGQHNLNTRASVRSRARPQRPHKSPEPPTGGEPVLGTVDIRGSAGQQAGKTMSSVRSRARPRGPHADSRPLTGGEPVLGHVNIRVPVGQQDLNTRSSASSSGARPSRPPAGKKPANRRHLVRRGGPPSRKSSAYKGVTHYLRTGRWEANIWHDGIQRYLGASATEIQAARAYDRALIHFRGVEALLNFNLNDYTGELRQLSNIRSEDLIHILRKQSKGHGEPMPDYAYGRQS